MVTEGRPPELGALTYSLLFLADGTYSSSDHRSSFYIWRPTAHMSITKEAPEASSGIHQGILMG